MSSITVSHSIKSEIKDTLSIGIPLIASQMVYASSWFIGTAMVAKLGQDALAASVLVNMIWISLSVLFFGMLGAVGVLVAHQFGAKNIKAISEIMGHSYVLGLITVFVIILLLFTMPWFLHLTTQPPSVIHLAIQYMHSMTFMVPGLIFLIINEQFLAGINRAKLVLRISLLVVPIEIPLIYILIFGKLGLPAFGIAGIGYGFAITYTSTAIWLIYYLASAKNYRQYGIFNALSAIKPLWLVELIRVGLPMGCMQVIEVSTFAIATFWMARFGTTMLAAHQLTFQYLGFAITIVFAMSQAVTVRVGHAVGQLDLNGVRYAIFIGMLLNFAIMFCIALALWLFPEFFLRLDINIHDAANASLIVDATMLLSISSFLMLFDNFRIIGFGALRGLKDTKFPMYTSFMSFWIIGLGSAFIFAFNLHLQGKGVWYGLTFGIACGALMVLLRLFYLLKHVDLAKQLKVG